MVTLYYHILKWGVIWLLSKFILNVTLPEMKNALFLICAIALFSANLVSVAHAHIEKQSIDQQIELSVDQNNHNDSIDSSDSLCDMHCHNHIASADFVQNNLPKIASGTLTIFSEAPTYSLTFELKRPPKI